MSNNTNTAESLDPIEMQSWEQDQLLAKAKELGVQVEESADASDVIAAIVDAQTTAESVSTSPEVGHLVSLHSRNDDAKALILAARNRIHANTDANRRAKLFLQDRNGNFYNRQAEFVRVSRERMDQVLSIVTPLPDGSQDELIQEYRDNPETFQDPLLVRLRRRNGDKETFGHYVMLYLRKKQAQLAEQVF
jgi:hypothetical protein